LLFPGQNVTVEIAIGHNRLLANSRFGDADDTKFLRPLGDAGSLVCHSLAVKPKNGGACLKRSSNPVRNRAFHFKRAWTLM
jgi:hypothetical protein